MKQSERQLRVLMTTSIANINICQLFVVLVLTLGCEAAHEELSLEDNLVLGAGEASGNLILGTFIKLGGGILNIAGKLGE